MAWWSGGNIFGLSKFTPLRSLSAQISEKDSSFLWSNIHKSCSNVTVETHPHRCSYLLSPWFGFMLIPYFICTPLMGVFFLGRFQGLICLFSYLQLRRLMIICPPGECKQLPVSSSTDTGGGISLWSMKTVYCWVSWGKKDSPTTVPQLSERWFHGLVSHQVSHVFLELIWAINRIVKIN